VRSSSSRPACSAPARSSTQLKVGGADRALMSRYVYVGCCTRPTGTSRPRRSRRSCALPSRSLHSWRSVSWQHRSWHYADKPTYVNDVRRLPARSRSQVSPAVRTQRRSVAARPWVGCSTTVDEFLHRTSEPNRDRDHDAQPRSLTGARR
jgi:hypothetical protein